MDLTRYFGDAALWFALLAPIVAAFTTLASARRFRRSSAQRTRWAVAGDVVVALTVLGVVCVTLTPGPGGVGGGPTVRLVPFVDMVNTLTSSVSVAVAARIVGMNVVLFVPLGFVLAFRRGRIRHAVQWGLVVSVAIEILQAMLPLSRTANVDDVILNGTGAAIGAATAVVVGRVVRRDPERGSEPATDDDAEMTV